MKIKSLIAAAIAGLFIGPMVGGLANARVTGTAPAATSPDTACWGRSGAEACVDRTGNFIPTTTNAQALGTSSLRFSNLFTTLLNVSGAITASGGIVASAPFRLPTLDVTVSSPTANVGDMCVTSAGVVYVSTNTSAAITSWQKVGAQ